MCNELFLILYNCECSICEEPYDSWRWQPCRRCSPSRDREGQHTCQERSRSLDSQTLDGCRHHRHTILRGQNLMQSILTQVKPFLLQPPLVLFIPLTKLCFSIVYACA